MIKDKSLIITSKDDGHADYIIYKINELGKSEKIIRLNTEDFITNCSVTFEETGFSINIKDSGRTINKNELQSVWYRRPKDFAFNTTNEKETAFIHKQAKSLLRGIYFASHDSSKWINPLTSLHRARVKMQQLVLAKELGFNVPKTMATNSPAHALEFINAIHQVSTKSLDEPNYQSDKHLYPIFNRKLKKDYIKHYIDHIESCPTLLQEYIEKQSDIRVVVIENTIYPFEIYSQENPLSIEDFRGVSPTHLRHELIELPLGLTKQIMKYMQHQKLIYSSFDFVRSKNDEIFFIENNPNGQWLWLELQTGIKISETFINTLLNNGN